MLSCHKSHKGIQPPPVLIMFREKSTHGLSHTRMMARHIVVVSNMRSLGIKMEPSEENHQGHWVPELTPFQLARPYEQDYGISYMS